VSLDLDLEFNLDYLNEDGNPVRARRVKGKRRILFEDGREFSASTVNLQFDYIGKRGEALGNARRNSNKYVTTVNGFKVMAR